MVAHNPTERKIISSIAGNESWARTVDRAARTAPARAAALDRFERQVDPAITDPVARAQAAEHLRRAYFARLALKSAQARRAKSKTHPPAAPSSDR